MADVAARWGVVPAISTIRPGMLPEVEILDHEAKGLPASPTGISMVAETTDEYRTACVQRVMADDPGPSRFHRLPEYRRHKQTPLAIVAGGPSLMAHIELLGRAPVIMVAGTAHDYVVRCGLRPRYAAILDASPHHVSSLQHTIDTCTYLIASVCAPQIYDALRDRALAVWHPLEGAVAPEEFKSEPTVQGGSTALLRAMSLGLLLGYRNQHFFGADSSFAGPITHSYPSYDPRPQTIEVRVAASGRTFQTSAPMAAQAVEFMIQLSLFGHLLKATVHGDGLLAEMIRVQREHPTEEAAA